jgi:hypothetical protein
MGCWAVSCTPIREMKTYGSCAGIQEQRRQRSLRPRIVALLRQAEVEPAKRNFPAAIRAVDGALRLDPEGTALQNYQSNLLPTWEAAEASLQLRTLEVYLGQTALAPPRVASATMAFLLSVLGLLGTLSDEGGRLACAGALGSLLRSRTFGRIASGNPSPAPVALAAAVAIASILLARRALLVNSLEVLRDEN